MINDLRAVYHIAIYETMKGINMDFWHVGITCL